jgi:hypothetical protein
VIVPATETSSAPPARTPPAPEKGFWRRADMLVLIHVTATLWATTLAWQLADFDALMTSWVKSEGDAWIFALTIAPFYFLIKSLAASWGVIVGIPTCLLATHLVLLRRPAKMRWLIAGGLTALVFIGVPMELNRREDARLAAYYQGSDAAGLPDLAGRAVELPRSAPLSATWVRPVSCWDECLHLLTFGRAKSVTLTFPSDERAPGNGPVSFTYRIGRIGKGCSGSAFRDLCPHFSDEPLPRDRVTLFVRPVEPKPGQTGVVARRLYAKDMRTPNAPPAQLTRFVFPNYSGLLNIAWKDGAFRLPRGGTPIMSVETLDKQLYRAAAPSKVLGGEFYPFH